MAQTLGKTVNNGFGIGLTGVVDQLFLKGGR